MSVTLVHRQSKTERPITCTHTHTHHTHTHRTLTCDSSSQAEQDGMGLQSGYKVTFIVRYQIQLCIVMSYILHFESHTCITEGFGDLYLHLLLL